MKIGLSWLTAPSPSPDPEKKYLIYFLNILLLLSGVGYAFGGIAVLAFRPTYSPHPITESIIWLGLAAGNGLALWLLHRGFFRVSASLLIVSLLVSGVIVALPDVESQIMLPMMVIVLLIVGLLLPARAVFIFAAGMSVWHVLWYGVWGGQPLVDILLGSVTFTIFAASVVYGTNWYYQQVRRERKRADHRYKQLFTSNRNALAVVEHGRIVEVNPMFQQTITALDDGPISLEAVFQHNADTVRRLIASGDEDPVEMAVQTPSDDPLPASVTVSSISGDAHSYLISIRDLTVIKQNEEHRLQLQLERERVRMMEAFIGDASHDLKTPLSVMKTSLYLLRRTYGIPENHRHLTSLQNQIDNMTRMFDDLLSLSRLDQDYKQMPMERYSLKTLLSLEIDENRDLAAQKSRHLHYAPPEQDYWTQVNPVELSRAVRQLLTNAIKYTRPNGTVCVRLLEQNERYVIEVQDDGIGIHADELPRLFERFYRADNARSIDTGGMGLGLSIVQRVMQAHGGHVEVESKHGEGSTFRLVFQQEAKPAYADQT